MTKPGEMAGTLSQVFLGVRIACAECHHHPFDRWRQSDYYGMTAFFACRHRRTHPANAPAKPVFAHALGTADAGRRPRPATAGSCSPTG